MSENPNASETATLTESAWRRAKVDATRVYRTATFTLGSTLLTTIASSLGLIAQAGQPLATQVAIQILAGATAILLSFVVVFIWQLIAAPTRQRNEERAARVQPANAVSVNVTLRMNISETPQRWVVVSRISFGCFANDTPGPNEPGTGTDRSLLHLPEKLTDNANTGPEYPSDGGNERSVRGLVP